MNNCDCGRELVAKELEHEKVVCQGCEKEFWVAEDRCICYPFRGKKTVKFKSLISVCSGCDRFSLACNCEGDKK